MRAYSLRGASGLAGAVDPDAITVFDAEIVALAAANEVDMHLSGEYRYTRRVDPGMLPQMELISQVCGVLGVPGLFATLEQASQTAGAVPDALKTVPMVSYRIWEGAMQPIRCELPDPEALVNSPSPRGP